MILSKKSTSSEKAEEASHGKIIYKIFFIIACCLLVFSIISLQANATGITIDLDTEGGEGAMGSMELLFLFTLLAVAPSLLTMVTSFTRIIIVFSFLRTALGLQQTPPNQVLIGLSLFLSFFIMQPVIGEITNEAIDPYMNGEITQEVAFELMQDPLKEFMLKQTNPKDISLFLSLSGDTSELEIVSSEQLMDLGMEIIIPSFITSELKYAFTIGFLMFLPFLVIDMVVSSTLMSMGMMMLPPSMIALPFKIMLFVVVDGWSLVMEMLVKSFY